MARKPGPKKAATKKPTARKAAPKKKAAPKAKATSGKTNGEKPGGTVRFKSGNPGGPGRPKGKPNTIRGQCKALIDSEAMEVIRATIESAKGGRLEAQKALLDRILPALKDEPCFLELPKIKTPADAVLAHGIIVDALNAGTITPAQSANLSASIDRSVRALETSTLADRLAAIENRLSDAAPNMEF